MFSYALGVSAPYSYVPATLDNSLSDNMNIWERFKNILQGTLIQHFFVHNAKKTRQLLNEHLK